MSTVAKELIGSIFLLCGFALLLLANISAIGVGLYEWAYNLTLAQAAWTGFVLWVQMLAGGVASLIAGAILTGGRFTRK